MEVLFITLVGEGDGRECMLHSRVFFVECWISFNLVSNFRLFFRFGVFQGEYYLPFKC